MYINPKSFSEANADSSRLCYLMNQYMPPFSQSEKGHHTGITAIQMGTVTLYTCIYIQVYSCTYIQIHVHTDNLI